MMNSSLSNASHKRRSNHKPSQASSTLSKAVLGRCDSTNTLSNTSASDNSNIDSPPTTTSTAVLPTTNHRASSLTHIPVDEEVDDTHYAVSCICGKPLIRVTLSESYSDEPSVCCNMCFKIYRNPKDVIYICELRKTTQFHNNGYGFCQSCAARLSNEEPSTSHHVHSSQSPAPSTATNAHISFISHSTAAVPVHALNPNTSKSTKRPPPSPSTSTAMAIHSVSSGAQLIKDRLNGTISMLECDGNKHEFLPFMDRMSWFERVGLEYLAKQHMTDDEMKEMKDKLQSIKDTVIERAFAALQSKVIEIDTMVTTLQQKQMRGNTKLLKESNASIRVLRRQLLRIQVFKLYIRSGDFGSIWFNSVLFTNPFSASSVYSKVVYFVVKILLILLIG